MQCFILKKKNLGFVCKCIIGTCPFVSLIVNRQLIKYYCLLYINTSLSINKYISWTIHHLHEMEFNSDLG